VTAIAAVTEPASSISADEEQADAATATAAAVHHAKGHALLMLFLLEPRLSRRPLV
jgi:hypothetical protein